MEDSLGYGLKIGGDEKKELGAKKGKSAGMRQRR
tara:strand:- start:389 stop:490 length:102 start_codon:yes stop_codon:yes gene_type:complete